MNSDAWLAYFRRNATRASAPVNPAVTELPPRLRGALVRSLGRFYLGEAGEGRVANEAARASDVALDDAMRESIALYVREEGRHARSLAALLRALGSSPPSHAWSERLFRRGRRLLGLRTKMLTIAAAEVVGLVYYRVLAERIPEISDTAREIAEDEEAHLEFQAEYFARVVARGPARFSAARAAAVAGSFVAIVTCATALVSLGHRDLLGAIGVTPFELVARCARQAAGAIAVCASSVKVAAGASEPLAARTGRGEAASHPARHPESRAA
jgi:hypothetical protein